MGGTSGSSFRLQVSLSSKGKKLEELTSLSDDSGVSSVLVEVGSNLSPKTLEDLGRSSKVKTTKLSVIDTLLNDLWWVSGNELDDGRW